MGPVRSNTLAAAAGPGPTTPTATLWRRSPIAFTFRTGTKKIGVNRRAVGFVGFVVLLAGGCRRAETPASPAAFDAAALEARYPADLGSALLDVSSYPPEKKADFELFAQKCSGRHTLARPLNLPKFRGRLAALRRADGDQRRRQIRQTRRRRGS